MKKKLILIAATFAIGVLSYLMFSIGDRRARRPSLSESPQVTRQFITPLTTQSVRTLPNSEYNLSPGEQPRVRVYDDVTGRLKYQFEAKSWEPISGTDYDLKDVQLQVYTPRGEISYISADQAQVTLSIKGKNRVEPKSGWLRKNVKVVVDRTTSAWREANPAIAAREAHPDDLTHIFLSEAVFDLELAELHSDGPVRLESNDAQIENVNGLTVQWNQVDGRIDVLRFKHGGRMALSRGGRTIDFGLPGGERTGKPERKQGPAGEATAQKGRSQLEAGAPKAQANMPVSIDALSGSAAASQIRMEGGAPLAMMPVSVGAKPSAQTSQPVDLRDPQALALAMETMQKEARGASSGEPAELLAREQTEKKVKARVHTYRAVFANHVVVEQKDGPKTIGKLEADRLELNFDFGKKQKEMASGDSTSAPSSQPASRPAKAKSVVDPAAADPTKLILTWDGPLEMHPLRNLEEPTGQRFDAIATGDKVTIMSEQGSGECKQLVYRQERKQAWLSGAPSFPVDLRMSDGKRLVAREIFFDQKRGLAHIEGAGTMTDARKTLAMAGQDESLAPQTKSRKAGKNPSEPARPPKEKKPQDPVQLTWSRGVDIEIGVQGIERINPTTGLREQKQKEFLRRAWFHGNVDMRQGPEQLTADEVAVTFGASAASDQVADHIQHLNMTGRVRLLREGDVITADHLDAEMTVTADGRNVPRVVDARGDAMAQQGKRVIRADHMHVLLGMAAIKGKTVVQGDMIVQETKSRVAIEAIDARGRVFAHDPDNQLKIRDADQLTAAIEGGSKLVHATIESLEGQPFAKVRAGETAIHGRHIDIDVPTESIDVPGPGKAWMITEQDFGGRKLSKPSPVKVTWSKEMQMRGQKNYGVFIGDVHSKSDALSLACDSLTVRLANSTALPKVPRASLMDQVWFLKAYHGASERATAKAEVADIKPKKRPTYVVADGNAEVLSSTYAVAPAPTRGRLLSRMQITGPQVVADLANQRMSVPGKGTLLLEDYQFDDKGRRSRSAAAPRSGPLMSSAQGEGPSQTVVLWNGSMDYYLDQNLVAFDQNVDMRHLSGRQMVMKEDLVAGMGMDPSIAEELREGRKAQLTAGYLLLQFKTAQRSDNAANSPPVRATDLEKLVAKHRVFLVVDTRTLMGEYLQYSADINEVQVEGSKTVEARIFDESESNQRSSEWRGPLLIWNRRTNAIEAPQSTVRTSRR